MNTQCSCNSDHEIKPIETCLFCAHKHLSSAIGLFNFVDDSKSIFNLRIASQVQLAAWHFNINFKTNVNSCNFIIESIFNEHEYKNDLILLTESTWKLIYENENNKLMINYDNNILKSNDIQYKNAILHVSNAIELLKYEHIHFKVNYSYAIGQLVLAHWNFQSLNKQLFANKCRNFYHNIEKQNINLNELEIFRDYIWKDYLSIKTMN